MPTLQLHGTPQVRLDDGPWLPLSAREAALLAWLHLEGPTPRARLAALLWPDGDDARARTNLRQTLARLKRSAGALWTEDAQGLALAVPVAADDGQPLLGPLQFDDADALAAWLAGRRAQQQRDRQRQALQQLQQLLAAGRLDEALPASDALLAADPESEEAWRLRMELFYLRGDRAAALAAWDECRLALRQAYGVAPSAATLALGQLILAGEPPSAPPQPAGAGLPTALRRPPRLVGRGTLLADVERCLALGHAVVLAGHGGMGKSRLLQELALRHDGALLVAASPADALMPDALLGRLLARALARWQPPLDEATRLDLAHLLPGGDVPPRRQHAQDRQRMLRAAVRALHACHGQGLRLVLLDDLQHADEASLEGLMVLTGHWIRHQAGALPVIGTRPDELGAAGRRLLDQLADSGRTARFDLAPLAHEDLLALLQALPLPDPPADAAWRDALAQALRAQVGGNPAHVLESLKGLWLDGIASWAPGRELPLPPTLVESVRRRLQRLGDEALQLAQLAAVAGSDFSLPLAGAALGCAPLALAPLLARLAQAQVFHGQGFAHDLVAEAVQASIPATLAAALHRLVAEHLASGPAAAEAAARIARHLQAAGDARAAAPWHRQAARRTRDAWQMAAAATAFEAAAAALDATGDAAARRAAADDWLDAARCWLQLRRDDEADHALQAAAARLPAAQHTRLLPARTYWRFVTRRLTEAVAGAEALIDALLRDAAAIDAPDLAWAVRVVSLTVPYGTDIERALRLAAAVEALPALQDEAALRQLRIARGALLHWASRPLEAAADLQAAWPAADAVHEAGTRTSLANQLMRVRHALGDLPGALALGELFLREAPPLEPGAIVLSDVLHVVAMIEIAQGEPAAGMARWAALRQLLHEAGVAAPDLYQTSQALACIAVGRLDEAADWLQRHPAPGRPGHGLQDMGWLLTRARLARQTGDDPSPWLDQAWRAEALPPGLLLQREVAVASITPPAYARLPPLLAQARTRGLRGQERTLHIAAARAAAAEGLMTEALQHVQQALALAAQVDAWIDEPASVWLAAHEVLHAAGRTDEAAAAARTGADWVMARADAWERAPHREAWLHGNPVHARLLSLARDATGAGAASG